MRIVIFHGGGNFRLAADTLASEIRSAAAGQGEEVEVDVFRPRNAAEVRNALRYGQLRGTSSEEADAADRIEFFTHSGPHGLYLTNQVGAQYNLSARRTMLNDAGNHVFDATPYSDVFTNLAPTAIINVHGCKFGTAKHNRPAGAQELSDATGATVAGYRSGSLFTHDPSLSSGARSTRLADITAGIHAGEPVWMYPGRAAGGWRVFTPRGQDVLPADQGVPGSTGDAELDRMLERLGASPSGSAAPEELLREAAEQAALEAAIPAYGQFREFALAAARTSTSAWASAMNEALRMAEAEAEPGREDVFPEPEPMPETRASQLESEPSPSELRRLDDSLREQPPEGIHPSLLDAARDAALEASRRPLHEPLENTMPEPSLLDRLDQRLGGREGADAQILEAARDAALEASRQAMSDQLRGTTPEPSLFDRLEQRLGDREGATAQILEAAREAAYEASRSPLNEPFETKTPMPSLLDRLDRQFGVREGAATEVLEAAREAALEAQHGQAAETFGDIRRAALEGIHERQRQLGSTSGQDLELDARTANGWADEAARESFHQVLDWNAQQGARFAQAQAFGLPPLTAE
ncbi:MAG: hypothetical protein K9L70_09875, partial [Thiohalocapsa sp.]|nr:hypothetical protein [Thiohalocapsa sp.]